MIFFHIFFSILYHMPGQGLCNVLLPGDGVFFSLMIYDGGLDLRENRGLYQAARTAWIWDARMSVKRGR